MPETYRLCVQVGREGARGFEGVHGDPKVDAPTVAGPRTETHRPSADVESPTLRPVIGPKRPECAEDRLTE